MIGCVLEPSEVPGRGCRAGHLRRLLILAGVAWLLAAPIVAASAAPAPRPGPSAKPAAPANANEAQSYAAFSEGQQLFKQGHWAEAIKALDQAVKTNDRNGQAWYLLGMAHMQLRHWSDAERCLNAAANLDARSYNAWVQLGDCAASQGQFDRARELVRHIFTFDPRSFYAYYALGVIDYREGRLGSAQSNFDHSRAFYEDFAPTWYNLAVCSYNLGQVSIAIQRIRRAVILEPKKPSTLFLMGWYANMGGDRGTGSLAFRNLYENDKHGSPYGDAARAYEALLGGKPAEARTFLKKALDKEPEMVKALVLEGLVLVKEGKKDEAIYALRRALELDPLDRDAREGLTRLGFTPPFPGAARLPGQPSKVVAPQAAPSGAPSSTSSPNPGGESGAAHPAGAAASPSPAAAAWSLRRPAT